MVLRYQRWTPPCGCSFEEEVDSETNEVKLLFAHEICGGHEDIAKNTPQPKLLKDTRKDDIIKAKRKAWDNNKSRHLSDFDNHPNNKRILKKLNVELSNKTIDSDTKILHDYYIHQRTLQEQSVDRITKEREIDMLIGLECPYSLNAQKVYDKINEEG